MMLPKLNLRLTPLSSTSTATLTAPTTRSRRMASNSIINNSNTTASSSRTRRLCCTVTYPLVLLSLLLLVLHPVISNAERDFNFNDSQVPLFEPKDEPILIEGHHIATTTAANTHHHNHNNNHQHHQDPYAVELSHCRYGDNELVLSLVLKNYNWHDLSEERIAKVLEKLSKFFAIPKEFITMESVTKHELYEMQKESLKKGNNKCHTNNINRKLGRVNFIIGCRTTYFSITEPIAKQIGQQVKDGALDNITGEKFGWWAIWRRHYKTRAMRNRRQVEGSGIIDTDDYEDEDDYDYGDEEIIEPPQANKETTSTSTSTTHNTNGQPADNNDNDEQPEITSNTLDVTKHEELVSHNRDDITALKHTDSEPTNVDDNKADSNLLLLNKKGTIDEEIVESVSKLESVISKTIENTKNIEDIPEIVVDQPEDVLLKKVLHQPTQPLEETEISKSADNLNLNTIYGSANDDKEFNVAEVIDYLSPQTSTATGVKLQESVYNSGDTLAATTASLPSTHHNAPHKDNHLENSLTSPSSNHDHHHHGHHGENGEQQQQQQLQHHHHHTSSASLSSSSSSIELTSTTTPTITLLTPPPPVILIDSTIIPPNDIISAITSSSMTSTPTTIMTTTTTTTITTNTSSDKPNKSNKMIKVDINKYDDENDDDDDEEDEEDENDDNDEVMQHFDNWNGKLYGLTTIMPPSQSHLPHSSFSSFTTAKKHSLAATTPEATNHAEDGLMETSENKHDLLLTTLAPYHHHLFNFLPSSSSPPAGVFNNEIIATTLLPYDLLTPSTTFATPPTTPTDIHERDELVSIESIVTGKKDEYYDSNPDLDDNQELSSSKAPSSTTPQSAAEDSVSSVSSQNPATLTTPLPSTSSSASSTLEVFGTTSPLPDYIEPKVENTEPIIKTRLQKFAVTGGKSFKFIIPEDTFYDAEDMSNLRLELTDKEGRELKANSWLQFNAETKEIYGLALDDTVSKWEYQLTATDSGNESAVETVEITVQQHRALRTVNHEVNIAVKINEKNMHYIDWQMKLINAIANTLGDDNANAIVVREIRQNPQDPSMATLVYFNETLPTHECPEMELQNLVKSLDANRLSDLVQPTLSIKSITGQLIGSCQKALPKAKPPTISVKNSPPVPRNQVDRVVATAGQLLVYKVPHDTFYDDGKLTLSLKTKDHKELSPRHWLQFDSKNDEFYGIPKTSDSGSEEYSLEAEDAGGLTATDALVVQVNHPPKREYTVYYKAYLAIKHEHFNADLQRKFVERIAQLFGDASTQNIQIRNVNTIHDTDSTTVSFWNTTLYKSHSRCPEEEMEAVRNVYLQDNNIMRERVRKTLGSELNITNIQVHSFPCNPPTDVHREFVPSKPEEPLLKSTFSDDYMYTIILPAIIIVTMIIVASLIACCLHRRRRKSGKMELGDEEERKSFRTKGIPVIFQDELDEKPEIGNKSPIILKDEKPPLLPPSYNTSNMNGDNDVDDYVPPPSVMMGGREARGKSPATPSYRKPPPYVSP